MSEGLTGRDEVDDFIENIQRETGYMLSRQEALDLMADIAEIATDPSKPDIEMPPRVQNMFLSAVGNFFDRND